METTNTEHIIVKYWGKGLFTIPLVYAHEVYGHLLFLTDESDNKYHLMEQFQLAEQDTRPMLSTLLGRSNSSENKNK